MPIVLIATPSSADANADTQYESRVVIEVSGAVGDRLQIKLGGKREGKLIPRHLPRLRQMALQRERDADLALLIRALEAHGEVYVRLI